MFATPTHEAPNLESVVARIPKPRGSSSQYVRGNMDLIRQIAEHRRLLRLLKSLMLDRSALDTIAGRSYQHVNLFDKIVLVGNSDPRSYRLTLHLWRPPYSEQQRSEELIHAHRFDFWSAIVAGSLVSQNYRLTQDGLPYNEYYYYPETARSKAFSEFYEPVGQVCLSNLGTTCRDAGEAYFMSAPTIHRIVLPQTRTTCSVVLRGPRLREYSSIYNTSYPSEGTSITRSMFSYAELRERLESLIAALEE